MYSPVQQNTRKQKRTDKKQFCTSAPFLPSSLVLLLSVLLHLKIFLSKALVYCCFIVFRCIGQHISLDLFSFISFVHSLYIFAFNSYCNIMNTPRASLPNVALKPVVVFHRIVQRCPRQSAPSMNCPRPTAASSSATPVTTSTPSWAAPLPPPLALTSPHKVAVAYFCARFHFSVGNFHWGISHDSFLRVTVMSPGIPILGIGRISANFFKGSSVSVLSQAFFTVSQCAGFDSSLRQLYVLTPQGLYVHSTLQDGCTH